MVTQYVVFAASVTPSGAVNATVVPVVLDGFLSVATRAPGQLVSAPVQLLVLFSLRLSEVPPVPAMVTISISESVAPCALVVKLCATIEREPDPDSVDCVLETSVVVVACAGSAATSGSSAIATSAATSAAVALRGRENRLMDGDGRTGGVTGTSGTSLYRHQ